MSTNKQALRSAAEEADSIGWDGIEYELDVGTRATDFITCCSPATVLALLDELEAAEATVGRLTAERDALRESEMGDGKYSNTRAAADIYFQLVEECEIPPGGSLVEHVDNLRDALAAAGITVKGE